MQKREKIRVFVFTATAGPNEFVGLDERARSKAVKDVRSTLRFARDIKLVDTREEAEVTLEILGRDRVADGGVQSIAIPIYGGSMIGAAVPTSKSVLWVRLSVVERDYRIDIVGQSGAWSSEADNAVDQVERWVKENYSRLRPGEQKK